MCILVPTPLFLFLVPYLHQFPAVKYITAEKVPFGAIWDKLSSYLIQIWYHDFQKIVLELHHLIVLFGSNLMSSKAPYSMSNLHFLMQMWCKFNVYFGWVVIVQRERDYYSKNLSILNISSNSEWNLFWDAKILITRKIITLFKS